MLTLPRISRLDEVCFKRLTVSNRMYAGIDIERLKQRKTSYTSIAVLQDIKRCDDMRIYEVDS